MKNGPHMSNLCKNCGHSMFSHMYPDSKGKLCIGPSACDRHDCQCGKYIATKKQKLSKPMKTARFVQIAACYAGKNEPPHLYALDENGGVWMFEDNSDVGGPAAHWFKLENERR